MIAKKSNKLIKLYKNLVDIIYGTLIIVTAGLLIWIILSVVLPDSAGINFSASIPVTLGTGDDPRMEVTFLGISRFAIRNPIVDGAKGTFRVETRDPALIIIANLSKLVIAAGLAYIFYLLRKIIQSLLAGTPFEEQSLQYIRRLGYAVLMVGFGGGIAEGLAAWEILRLLPETIPAMQARATFDSRLVLGSALFIFLLVQIWGYGLELERDRALTI